MNIISFSVYGDKKLYCQGAIDNISAVEKYYGGNWMPRFYTARNCPVLSELQSAALANKCQVIEMPEWGCVDGSTVNAAEHRNPVHMAMSWRNLPLFDGTASYVLLRDTDSRVNPREADAVLTWMVSLYDTLAIYDHPNHVSGIIMPGLTGWKTNLITWTTQEYQNKLLEFQAWYNAQAQLTYVHYDIWLMQWLIQQFHPRLKKVGFNTIHPLRAPMPLNGSCGKFCGDTVHEEWRYQSYDQSNT